MTPCQVMRASDKKVYFATPGLWSFMCNRQGSWYRASPRNGQFMMMSEDRLPEAMERFRDAELGVSDFQPDSLPTDAELAEVVASDEYQQGKPSDWEGIGFKDAVMFKTLFPIPLPRTAGFARPVPNSSTLRAPTHASWCARAPGR